MRRLLTVLLVGLVVVPAAQAKLNPAFSERVTEAGAEIDLGEGSEQFLGPLRIYLVPLGVADQLQGEDDPRLIKIGELGTPGEFGTPSILRFEVPDVPAGEYTAAIWFKGYATGTWANALVGIHPLVSIRSGEASAAAATSEGGGGLPLWAVGLAAGALLAAVGGWLWRRSIRRPAIGASLR
jgi:hypothetical protein